MISKPDIMPPPPPVPPSLSRPKFKPPQSKGAGRGLATRWGPENREGGFCRPLPPIPYRPDKENPNP